MRDHLIRYLCLTLLVLCGGTAIISGGIMLFTFFSSMYSPGKIIEGISWATLSFISGIVASLVYMLGRTLFGDEFPGGSRQLSESFLQKIRDARWLRGKTWQIGLGLVAILFVLGLAWNFKY